MRPVAAVLLIALASAAAAPAATPPAAPSFSGFSGWAAVVVAGDATGSDGEPTAAFDNARRDLALAWVQAGFTPDHLRQFSARPTAADPPFPPLPHTSLRAVEQGLTQAARAGPDGCLMYITSHGAPQGVLLGEDVASPGALRRVLDRACGTRPTVVVVSACYSGVFVGPLAAPHRLVLTAARPDRSSFGCGSGDRYPFFDACVLEALPTAADLPALGRAAQACVQRLEREAQLTPPSEPQLSVGEGLPPLPLQP